MTAHQIFCIGLLLIPAMFVCFYKFFNPTPNMQTFKKAGSKEAAAGILDQWGAAGQKTARANLKFDWLFILVYSATWITGAMTLGPRFDSTLRVPAIAFAAIGLAGALCDLIENACLWLMLRGNNSEIAPRVCKQIMKLNIAFFLIAADYFFHGAIVTGPLAR